MKLKEVFKVVFSIVMAVFILSVSMGMNISRMKCDEEGSVYLGTEVPSCSVENEVVCNKEQEKVSCCILRFKNHVVLKLMINPVQVVPRIFIMILKLY